MSSSDNGNKKSVPEYVKNLFPEHFNKIEGTRCAYTKHENHDGSVGVQLVGPDDVTEEELEKAVEVQEAVERSYNEWLDQALEEEYGPAMISPLVLNFMHHMSIFMAIGRIPSISKEGLALVHGEDIAEEMWIAAQYCLEQQIRRDKEIGKEQQAGIESR